MDSDSSVESHSNSGSSPDTPSVKGSDSECSVGSPENQEEVESDVSADSPDTTVIENQVAGPESSDHSVASPSDSDHSASSTNPDNDVQESEKEETQALSDDSTGSPDGTKSNRSVASPNGSAVSPTGTKSNGSVASPDGSAGSREEMKSNGSVASPDGSVGSTSADENVENGEQNLEDSDGSTKSVKKETMHNIMSNESKPENGVKKSNFADDLSDVSEGDSDDGLGAFGDESPPQTDLKITKNVSLKMEAEEEQLDFEVEEEGECGGKFQDDKSQNGQSKQKDSDLEDGEISDDGETRTEEEPKPICKFYTRGHCTWGTNCRFIHPGVPDKGNYTMFESVRPIPHATTVHAPPPMPAPMLYPMVPPHVIPPAPERPVVPAVAPTGLKKDEPLSESSWERGLRQAKEMIRKSSKRKESDVDFHDKKMNLTIQQQEETEKETEFYPKKSKSPRPSRTPENEEKWKENDKHHRIMLPEHGPPPGDLMPPHMEHPHPMGYYPHPMPPHVMPRPEYWMGPHRMPYDEFAMRGPQLAMPPYADYYAARRYLPPNSYYPPRHGMMAVPPVPSPHPPPEYYDRKHKHRSYTSSGREVIIQKSDKSYKDESPARHRRREESPRMDRRADEWSDPWMRSKSPHSRRRHRRESSSTKSSYSSSSRSSSRSSYERRSKLSRNKNKSNSSSSPSPAHPSSELRTRKKPAQFKRSPSSRTQTFANRRGMKKSPSVQSDRRIAPDRATHFVSSPSPKSPMEPSLTGLNPSPPVPSRRNASRRMKPSIAVGSSRSLSKSSTSSSSSSESSGSSASSGSSSSGSKSSGKSLSPPPSARIRKTYLSDQSIPAPTAQPKGKTVESKVPGTKPGIKLTLKGNGGVMKRSAELNTLAPRKVAGKKRSVPSNSESDSDYNAVKKSSKLSDGKGTPTRREELLKQLKAVEDAIAKKRSKVQ